MRTIKLFSALMVANLIIIGCLAATTPRDTCNIVCAIQSSTTTACMQQPSDYWQYIANSYDYAECLEGCANNYSAYDDLDYVCLAEMFAAGIGIDCPDLAKCDK